MLNKLSPDSKLAEFIEDRWLNADKVLEYLTEQNAISDNVIDLSDVGNQDDCIKLLDAIDNLDFLC